MSWPREGSREVDEGIIISEPMDWCRSPTAIVPYRIWAYQREATDLADTVRQTDDRTHVKDSIILRCYGDHPGNGGGVISGTYEAECTPKTWSQSVFAEGRNVVRHDDEWWMNHKNTYGRLDYQKDMSTGAPPPSRSIEPKMAPPEASAYQASYTEPDGAGASGSAPGGSQLAQEFFIPEEVAPFLRGPLRPGPGLGPRLAPRVAPRFAPKPGPEPGPEPKPMPRPPLPGFRVTGCRSELICFEPGKYNEEEYRRQLKIQQDGINEKTACMNTGDIDRFDKQSPTQKAAQRSRANTARDKYLEQYSQSHPLASLAGKDALHRVDMVAGGYEADFADVGDSGVNRSIGPEWPADSRKGKLKRYAEEMCKNGCRMSVTLDICETPPGGSEAFA